MAQEQTSELIAANVKYWQGLGLDPTDHPAFVPAIVYMKAIDRGLMLTEEIGFVSEPVNRWVDLLWHPREVRLVGFALTNFQFFCERAKAIRGDGSNLVLGRHLFEIAHTCALYGATADASIMQARYTKLDPELQRLFAHHPLEFCLDQLDPH